MCVRVGSLDFQANQNSSIYMRRVPMITAFEGPKREAQACPLTISLGQEQDPVEALTHNEPKFSPKWTVYTRSLNPRSSRNHPKPQANPEPTLGQPLRAVRKRNIAQTSADIPTDEPFAPRAKGASKLKSHRRKPIDLVFGPLYAIC